MATEIASLLTHDDDEGSRVKSLKTAIANAVRRVLGDKNNSALLSSHTHTTTNTNTNSNNNNNNNNIEPMKCEACTRHLKRISELEEQLTAALSTNSKLHLQLAQSLKLSDDTPPPPPPTTTTTTSNNNNYYNNNKNNSNKDMLEIAAAVTVPEDDDDSDSQKDEQEELDMNDSKENTAPLHSDEITLSHSSSSSSLSSIKSGGVSIRKYLPDIRRHRTQMLDMKSEWTERSSAITSFTDLTRSIISEGGVKNDECSIWTAEIKECIGALNANVQDLRSSIVKEVCALIVSIAQADSSSFHASGAMSTLLPTLMKLLYVTIKVISQSGADCVSQLLKTAPHARTLHMLCTSPLTNDSHSVVREHSALYTRLLLENLTVEQVKEYSGVILSATKAWLADGDGAVRAAARSLLIACARHWPIESEGIEKELPRAMQKQIVTEREGASKKVAAAAAPAAGAAARGLKKPTNIRV